MGHPTFLESSEVQEVYRRRARHYDITANLYYLLGFREWHYRREAVAALGLAPGMTIVELGCGTGLNFGLLEKAVGPAGRIIGVDPSPEMLQAARQRVGRKKWQNVALVESTAAAYALPQGVDAILSTFALTLEPAYEAVIKTVAGSLPPGKRFVVLDLRLPDGRLRRLAPLLIPFVRPFAVSLEVARRRPWEAIARDFPRHSYRALFFGFAYISVGETSAGRVSTVETRS